MKIQFAGFVLLTISVSIFAQTGSGIKGVVAENARPELVQEGIHVYRGAGGYCGWRIVFFRHHGCR